MTKPKPKASYSTTNLQTPMCTKQLACDGDNLVGAARTRGFCNKCKEAEEKRANKGPKPLRGENTALYEAQRRTIQKPKESK